MAVTESLYDKASLLLVPSGVKAANVYSQKPYSGDGDFTFDRNSTATRVNAAGYIETVAADIPRLDFPIVNGQVKDDPALLLEPSRTNLITESEDLSGYSNFGSTDTADSGTAPDGTDSATLLEGDGTQTQAYFATPNITLASAGSYTMSVFAKKGTNNFLYLFTDGFVGATGRTAFFDLENGSTPTSGATIEDYGNGWYRCSKTVTILSSDLIGKIAVNVSATTSTQFFGSASAANGKNIYLFGFQLEAGSYATSYIPTSGSSVTRSAETCNSAGTSAEFNDSEGVLYMEIQSSANDDTYKITSISDGTSSNRITLGYNNTDNKLLIQIHGGGVATVNFTYAITNALQYNKFALKYESNDVRLWINGVEEASDSTATMPSGLSEFNFNYTDGLPLYGKVKEAIVFKEALTDAELTTLTS